MVNPFVLGYTLGARLRSITHITAILSGFEVPSSGKLFNVLLLLAVKVYEGLYASAHI